eukprot:COSAG06_NODE_2509_length_6742_cov_3.061418_7_plen_72_part_00
MSSVLADCRSCLATATRQLQISAARPLLLEEPRCDVLCPAEQVRWQVRREKMTQGAWRLDLGMSKFWPREI